VLIIMPPLPVLQSL